MSFTYLIINGWVCYLYDKAWTISITFKTLNKLTLTQVLQLYLPFLTDHTPWALLLPAHSVNMPVTHTLQVCHFYLECPFPCPISWNAPCLFKAQLKCKLLSWNLPRSNRTKWLKHWLWKPASTVWVLTLLLFRHITLIDHFLHSQVGTYCCPFALCAHKYITMTEAPGSVWRTLRSILTRTHDDNLSAGRGGRLFTILSVWFFCIISWILKYIYICVLLLRYIYVHRVAWTCIYNMEKLNRAK